MPRKSKLLNVIKGKINHNFHRKKDLQAEHQDRGNKVGFEQQTMCSTKMKLTHNRA